MQAPSFLIIAMPCLKPISSLNILPFRNIDSSLVGLNKRFNLLRYIDTIACLPIVVNAFTYYFWNMLNPFNYCFEIWDGNPEKPNQVNQPCTNYFCLTLMIGVNRGRGTTNILHIICWETQVYTMNCLFMGKVRVSVMPAILLRSRNFWMFKYNNMYLWHCKK